MRSIHEVIDGNGPADDQEARALAAAACEGITDSVAYDYFVSELETALVMMEVEAFMGGGDAVRDYARDLLRKIEEASG